MSEEGIIYSELKLSYPKKPKGKTQAAQNRKGFPWRIIAASLGIIICLFLVTVPVLRYAYFQASYKHQNNDTQEHENSSSHVEKNCFSKIQSNPEKYKEEYRNKWFCCGKKWYYFSDSDKSFEDSKKFCINMDSHLVKIEDKDEQKFIQSLVSYFHWIGLSRRGIHSRWMWEDGSLMHYDFKPLQDSNLNNNCVYTSANKLIATLCTKLFFFICEKNALNSDLKLDEYKQ